MSEELEKRVKILEGQLATQGRWLDQTRRKLQQQTERIKTIEKSWLPDLDLVFLAKAYKLYHLGSYKEACRKFISAFNEMDIDEALEKKLIEDEVAS